MAALKWVLHPLFYKWAFLIQKAYNLLSIGARQPVVPCRGQPFWGQIASAEAHRWRLYSDGCRGSAHWPDTFLNGTVINQDTQYQEQQEVIL